MALLYASERQMAAQDAGKLSFIPLASTTQRELDLPGLCCYNMRCRPSSPDYAFKSVVILAPCIQANASSLYLLYYKLRRDS